MKPALLAVLGMLFTQPALADPISITQEKTLAGGISSGDGPGWPILITDPGSYRLDTNLQPIGPATFAIYVASPNVTIDFNGFRLLGFNGHGIIGSQPGGTIKNGTITDFQGYAIFAPAESWTIENMKVLNSGLNGIACGDYCIVRDSNVTENGGTGIRMGESSLVESCIVSFHSNGGIILESGMVIGSVIFENTSKAIINDNSPSGTDVGYGNNTIFGHVVPQTSGATPLAPNACNPVC